MGSGVLIGSLMAADLIDEYLLMIHPLAGVLAGENRVVAWGSGFRAPLVIVCHYHPYKGSGATQ
jgi:riboflavin biosynthesis pyrimidine reductase